MYHHSFERTLTYDDTLSEWLASAATMPLRDRVMIMPAVKNRYATLFSKKAIETKDFEVRFTMSATDNGEGGPEQDGVLAFWISLDNYAKAYNEEAIISDPNKDWGEGLKTLGHTLLANRPVFKGLGVAFFGHGRDKGHRKQHVAALWNDGSKRVEKAESLMDEALGSQVKALDWMTAGTEVSVRVARDGSITGSVMTLDLPAHLAGSLWGWAPDGVNNEGILTFESDGKVKWKDGAAQGGWVVLSGNRLQLEFEGQKYVLRFEGSHRAVVEEPRRTPASALLYGGKDNGPVQEDWVQVFKMPSGTFPLAGAECFVGFTGFTGTKSYVEVDLHRLQLTNFDGSTAGEDESDLLATDTSAWLKVLEEEKRYVTQASQTEAVKRLLKLLTDHVDRYDRLGEQLRSDTVRMEDRLDKLGADLSNYLAATQAWSFEAQQFDSQAVKGRIAWISSVLTKNRQEHDEKLKVVHKAAQDLKATRADAATAEEPSKRKVQAVAEKAKAVTEMAAQGSRQTSVLLFMIVLAFAGLGLLFLNRMRYYEKKHYI